MEEQENKMIRFKIFLDKREIRFNWRKNKPTPQILTKELKLSATQKKMWL